MTPANCARWRISAGRPCECGRHVAGVVSGADCHPERPNVADGLCGTCYAKQRRWLARSTAWRPRGCHGHPCDACSKCVRGLCCRLDDADYRLPQPGDVEVSYGAIGSIEEDADGQQCHMCGGWFRLLHKHAYHAHDLLPDEYRAAFGLARGQPLTARRERVIRGDRLKPWWQADGTMIVANRPTPEQASVWSSRPERIQVRDRKRPLRELLARTVLADAPRPPTQPNTVACCICGDPVRVPPSAAKRSRRTCLKAECMRRVRMGRIPGNAKLNAATAEEIRAASGTQSEIAARYGVTQTLVSQIRRGIVWRLRP